MYPSHTGCLTSYCFVCHLSNMNMFASVIQNNNLSGKQCIMRDSKVSICKLACIYAAALFHLTSEARLGLKVEQTFENCIDFTFLL